MLSSFERLEPITQMLDRLLTPKLDELLSRERGVLRTLEATLIRIGADPEDQKTLGDSILGLDQLFLLVVVGEFNSGKSTFINALLGQHLLEEGVTPTTRQIHRLFYGESRMDSVGDHGIHELAAPIPLLKEVEIVDTPGTNALDRGHEAITKDFVPRSDLVLFVTSADRPFSESERVFMEQIREWGKKLVIVVNKVDFLETDEDLSKVKKFIGDNALALLDSAPEIFAISARKALEAKLDDDNPELAAESRIFRLEQYLRRMLDDQAVLLKLQNPLGVGARLLQKYTDSVQARIDLLKDDFRALEQIDLQLGLYQEDLAKEFRFRLTDVDNELHEFEKRGNKFFDDTLRLARAFDLINQERVKAEFEREVVADTPQQIENKVGELIDWMVSSELKQWQALGRQLEARKSTHPDQQVGSIGEFDFNRQQLLDTVGRAAQRTIGGFDQSAEAARMADSVKKAVAGTALVEAGAIGLGALFSILATTQLADFTGLLAAGTMAVLGFFILPAKKRRAKKDLAAKILELRKQLMSVLTEQFERESERSVLRIQESVAPYTRFVRAEGQRLTATKTALDDVRGAVEQAQEALRQSAA